MKALTSIRLLNSAVEVHFATRHHREPSAFHLSGVREMNPCQKHVLEMCHKPQGQHNNSDCAGTTSTSADAFVPQGLRPGSSGTLRQP